MNFDPSIKKKKKKKKTAFDPDADGGDEEAAPAGGEEGGDEPVKKEKKVVFDEGAGEDAEDIDLESFGKKKKKKKVREGLDSMEDVKEALPVPDAAADEEMDLDNLDDFGSKKKKKKKNRKLDDLADEDEDKENAGDESSGEQLKNKSEQIIRSWPKPFVPKPPGPNLKLKVPISPKGTVLAPKSCRPPPTP